MDEPVSICALKRFAGDFELIAGSSHTPKVKTDSGKQVAVVGGGPAGLAAAYYLALEGHRVTIFDAAPKLGGMMRYGIPEYRLPKEVLDQEIQAIAGLCQNVFLNKVMGRDFTISQLKKMGFNAVFIGIGSWANQSLGLSGEKLAGVYSGIQFLREVASGRRVPVGSRVVVIGGGNTAMDAARTSVRLGAGEVTVVYRRSRNEMPASRHEVEQAEEEGVKFELLTAPVGFIGKDGRVQAITCIRMCLGEPDNSGRCRPVPIEGSAFEIPVDTVITATGQKLDLSSIQGSSEITLGSRDVIKVDKATLQGDADWIFAGGDCVTGPATVVEAVAAGRKAADSINLYLQGKEVKPREAVFNCSRGTLAEIDPEEFNQKEKKARVSMPTMLPETRKHSFYEFEHGLSQEMAWQEANRCLSCGCLDIFDCRLRDYATRFKVKTERLGTGKKTHSILEGHPHIISDPNKCVLCGNCIRVCQEIMGIGALGFVNRGSETVVLPSLNTPLAETLCTSCAQCVEICPTGALTVKNSLAKPGPWRTDKVESICSHCSIGCKLDLSVSGQKVVSVTSSENSDYRGDICGKGAFQYSVINGGRRLVKPLVSKKGRLEQVEWTEALESAARVMTEVRESAGLNSIAVVVAPGLTNEENYLAYKLARTVLGTNLVLGAVPVGVLPGMAREHIPSFADLSNSDLILAVSENGFDQYPVMAAKIRRAVKRGSKLLTLSSSTNVLESLANSSLRIPKKKYRDLLHAFCSYVLQYELIAPEVEQSYSEKIEPARERFVEDFYELVGSLWVKPHKIVEFIHQIIRAKSPILVVDGFRLTNPELELLAQFALLTGNLGFPGRGIISLYPHSNIQGQLNLGVGVGEDIYSNLLEEIKGRKIQGMLIIGDGSALDQQLFQSDLRKVVITPLTNEDLTADIVLPGSVLAETSGSVTNSEGSVRRLKLAIPPPGGKENWQILMELARLLGYEMGYHSPDKIFSDMVNQVMKG